MDVIEDGCVLNSLGERDGVFAALPEKQDIFGELRNTRQVSPWTQKPNRRGSRSVAVRQRRTVNRCGIYENAFANANSDHHCCEAAAKNSPTAAPAAEAPHTIFYTHPAKVQGFSAAFFPPGIKGVKKNPAPLPRSPAGSARR